MTYVSAVSPCIGYEFSFDEEGGGNDVTAPFFEAKIELIIGVFLGPLKLEKL